MKNLPTTIAACVLCAALIGGYVFMYARVTDGIDRTARALQQTQSLSERDALIRSQQLLLEDIHEQRTQLDSYVVAQTDAVSAIELIEEVGRNEGVALVVSTVDTAAGDGWQEHEGVVVNFSAEGTFREMMRLMSALEHLPVASNLSRASLEVSGTSGWFGTFSVTFVKKK